jgi:hypothetical protein
LDYYKGINSWGNTPRFSPFPYGFFTDILGYPLEGGTEVMWYDSINPVKFCETRHFGLTLNPLYEYFVELDSLNWNLNIPGLDWVKVTETDKQGSKLDLGK